MSKAAAIVTARSVGGRVVMACADRVDFHKAVIVGQLVRLVARVARSSTNVKIEFIAETSANPIATPLYVAASKWSQSTRTEGRWPSRPNALYALF
jgi:acyl-CoA hydrolase